ncbi:Endonuclease/Exonuclease/phosphatase family protein [Ceratocystis lukuohia]|uniref:Endonuclease/Exonuclease/phosphatase family protein n=1 Tax=Ceratocystis lukuohia TaxID=2019550 RepID=A0ABR4MFW0_9PEZI
MCTTPTHKTPPKDSRRSESGDCSSVLDWLSEDDITLLNEPGNSTCFHSKESPSVIDLAFASSNLLGQSRCMTKVMKELNCSSDHFPLSTTIEGIQINGVVRATQHNMNRLDIEKFTRACTRESTCLNAREPLRAEDVEELTAGLIKAMTKALDEVAPKALGKGTGKRMVNQLGKTNPARGLPPLTQGSAMRSTPQEKAKTLLDTYTQPVEDCSRAEAEANPRARLWGKLTLTEVRDIVFSTGNTALGEDSIPNTAWRLAWLIFGHIQVCDDGGDPETILRQDTPKELPADLTTVNPWEKP